MIVWFQVNQFKEGDSMPRRPRKDRTNILDVQVGVRLRKDEKRAVDQIADNNDTYSSAWIRQLVVNELSKRKINQN